jgi:hypothetical protein
LEAVFFVRNEPNRRVQYEWSMRVFVSKMTSVNWGVYDNEL